jgi:hypothetical protein
VAVANRQIERLVRGRCGAGRMARDD